jgi:hypothetical protein
VDVSTVEQIVEYMRPKYVHVRRMWVMDRGMVSEEHQEQRHDSGASCLVGTLKFMLSRFEKELRGEDWSLIEPGVEVKLCTASEGAGERRCSAASLVKKKKNRPCAVGTNGRSVAEQNFRFKSCKQSSNLLFFCHNEGRRMKKVLAGLLMVLGSVLLSGCVGNTASVRRGGEIHIIVLCDRGDEASMEKRQWRYRNEVGAFMEPDLVRRLQDYMFSSALIHGSEFKKEPNWYLLKVKITSYNPGSSAARNLARWAGPGSGYGIGVCSLDCGYELIDSNGAQVLAWTDGVATSRVDWRRLPLALNKRVGKKLSEHFRK